MQFLAKEAKTCKVVYKNSWNSNTAYNTQKKCTNSTIKLMSK